jgi:tetratricopeptide (TPR) repeat protein
MSRVFAACLAIGFATAAMPVCAQAVPSSQQPQDLSPETRALMAEIETWGEKDQSADPAGDLVKLANLSARVQANSKVPPMERGLLASAIGAAHFYTREYNLAAEFYGKAAELFGEAGAPPEEMAGLFNNQATILASIGRYQEAEQSHLRALAIRRGMEGERGAKVSSSLFGLGYVYFRQGRMEEAVQYMQEALKQQLEFIGPDNPQSIMRLASLASVLGASGREAEALGVARRAEELGRANLGDAHPTYAIALNNLGNALIENGLFAEAVSVLRESLRVRQQTIGEGASGTAITLRNLGTALKETGHPEEAEQITARALAIYEKSGEVETPQTVPFLYAELAAFAAERGDWVAYAGLAEKSLVKAAETLAEYNHFRAHLNLLHAVRLEQQGRLADALAATERWVPVIEAALVPRHKDRIWAKLLLARLRQAGGAQDPWPLADEAIALLSEKLGDLAATDYSLVREARTHRDAARLYLDMAASAGDAERTFVALQLVNISELSVGQQFASEDTAAQGAAQSARRELLVIARRLNEVRARRTAALAAEETEEAAKLATELSELESRKTAAEIALKRDFPQYVASRRPQPISAAAMQRSLRPGDILLAPALGGSRNWLLSVGRDRLAITALPADLPGRAANLRRAAEAVAGDNRTFPFADAYALYQALLPRGVAANGRVLLYGGGVLDTLPLTVLTTKDYSGPLRNAPWLVRDASFQVVGNVALFGRRDRSRPAGRQSLVIGVGGPDPPGASGGNALAALFRSGRPAKPLIADLPALPNAAQELRQIADALPGNDDRLFIGEAAAEENFKKADLRHANVIAFATHGLVGGEVRSLWEPALLLGTNGPESGEDGLLGASEIARLRLNADWVILSACNTAAGDGAGGAVYSGLATSFAQAGAKALLLSHWRVRDDAAARLSVETVRGTSRGLDRAEALRQAQLRLIGDNNLDNAGHPAIWAPFVLIEN